MGRDVRQHRDQDGRDRHRVSVALPARLAGKLAPGLAGAWPAGLAWALPAGLAAHGVHGLGQGVGDVVEQPGADGPESRISLPGCEIDHAQDRLMIDPEGQELRGESLGRGTGSRTTPVGAAHDRGQPAMLVGHMLGEHQHGRLDVRKVLVERGRAAASGASNVDHGQIAVGPIAQQRERAPEQAAPRGQPPGARNPAVHSTYLARARPVCRHGVIVS
jgi:hypothetical protein